MNAVDAGPADDDDNNNSDDDDDGSDRYLGDELNLLILAQSQSATN